MLAPCPVFQFAGGAKDVGDGIRQNELDQWIGGELFRALEVAGPNGIGIMLNEFQGLRLLFRQFLQRRAAGQFLFGKPQVFLFFQRIEFIKQTRRGESKGRAGFAGGPDVHQPVQHVFLLLQAEFVTGSARSAFAAAEATPLIKDDGLDRRKQLRRSHQPHRHAGAAKDRFDDLAVRVPGNDHAVFDRIAADNPAGGHPQIERRIVGGRKLVHEFFRRSAAVPRAGIAFLEDHHATALDALVIGVHGGGDDVGEAHVRDETSAFLHLQERFAAVVPIGDAHLAGEHACFDACEGQGLGQGEGGSDLLPVLTRFGGRGAGDVFGPLLGRAALVNGSEPEVPRETAGGRARVHPGKFESNQRQREIFRPGEVAAVFGLQKCRGDAAVVEGGQKRGFLGRPIVGVAGAGGDQARHGSSRHATGGLDEHVELILLGEPPHYLADVIPGEGLERGR